MAEEHCHGQRHDKGRWCGAASLAAGKHGGCRRGWRATSRPASRSMPTSSYEPTTVPRPGPPTNAVVPAGMEDVEQGSWVQRRGAHWRQCGEQPEPITPAAGIGGVGGVGLGI